MSTVEHRYGPYGGQYVPETLMPALEELERAWVEAWAAADFRAELALLLRDFAGRPTPLYEARRLSERAGRPIWLKRARGSIWPCTIIAPISTAVIEGGTTTCSKKNMFPHPSFNGYVG